MIRTFTKIACLTALLMTATAMTTPSSAQVDNRQQVVDIKRGDSLNVRMGPGSQFQDIGDIKRNQYVPVLGYDTTGRWAKVFWRNREAWVSAQYLSGGIGGQNLTANNASNSATYAPGLGPHVVSGVLADDPRGLALRRGPGTKFQLEQYLGDHVEVFVVSRSSNGNWAFIKFSNGTGYVWTKYLQPIGGGQSGQNANGGNQNNGGNSNNQSGQGAGGAQMQTPVPAPDGLPLPAVFSVTNVQAGDLLNVRAQASPSAPILSGYQPNAPVVVLAYLANGWAQISVGETLGYVNGNFLTRGGGVQTQSGMQLGLICRGTEPFWTLKMDDDGTVTYESLINGAEQPASLNLASASTITNSYPYHFGAPPYSGTMTQQVCSDGMSDIQYGWGMTLIKPKQGGGWETLNGCCTLQ